MTKTLLAIALTIAAGYLAISKFGSPFATPKNGWERKAALETPWQMSWISSKANTIANWPPVDGKQFPQVELFDHTGKQFELKSLRGKPTVIEFISMSCAGCQAFAGANETGPYGNLASQPGLESFATYFRKYSGVNLHSDKINYVVAVVYNDKLKNPTAQDLSDWRSHFGLEHANTHIVSGPDLASGDSFRMIPGFMLLDKDQVVIFDSTGHHPKHDLYRELIPGVRPLLKQ